MQYKNIIKGILAVAAAAYLGWTQVRINALEARIAREETKPVLSTETVYLELHKSPEYPLYQGRVVENPLEVIAAWDDLANRPLMEEQIQNAFKVEELRKK